ncbi:hypothetical protein UFOVP217_4 [uncultured Caudovirales phage]|uniref:Uncharacterized protein n=1 Tax=uncultured Caudovirales phage TaxID=2100421 RepID=A0A6J7WSQ5_9CAUD|nr:hypothetical protein UFOVP217_4 [uncultured Caudovirales phage]
MIYILLFIVIIIVMVGVYLWYKFMFDIYNDQELNKEQKKAKKFYNNLKLKNNE